MPTDPPGLQQHETKTHPPSRHVPPSLFTNPCGLHLDPLEELWLYQNLSKMNEPKKHFNKRRAEQHNNQEALQAGRGHKIST